MTADHSRPRLPEAWANPGAHARAPEFPIPTSANPTTTHDEYESLPTISIVDPQRLFARDGVATNGQASSAWAFEDRRRTESSANLLSSGTFGLPGQSNVPMAVSPRSDVPHQDAADEAIRSADSPPLIHTSYSAHDQSLSSPAPASLRDIVQPPLPDLTLQMADDYLHHPAGKGKVFPIPEHRPECQPPTSLTKRIVNNLQKLAARSPTVPETSAGPRLGPVSLKSRDAVTKGHEQAAPDDTRIRTPRKMRMTIDTKEVDPGLRTLKPDYFIPMPREETHDEFEPSEQSYHQISPPSFNGRDADPAKSDAAAITPQRPVRSPLRRAPPPPSSTTLRESTRARPVSNATSVISQESLSFENNDDLPDLYPFSYTEDDQVADELVRLPDSDIRPKTIAKSCSEDVDPSNSPPSPHITAAHRSLAEYSDVKSYFDIPLPNALPPPPLPRAHEATATAKKRYGIASLKWAYDMEVVGFRTWARDKTDVARKLSKMQGIEEEQPDPVSNGSGGHSVQSGGYLAPGSPTGWEDMPDFDIDLNEGISSVENICGTAPPTNPPQSEATAVAKKAATEISGYDAKEWTGRGSSGLQVGLIAPSQYIGPRDEHRARPRIDHDDGPATHSRSSGSAQDERRETRRDTGSISHSTTAGSGLLPPVQYAGSPRPARIADNGNRMPLSAHRQETKYSHVNPVSNTANNDCVPDDFFNGTLRRIFEAAPVGFDVPSFSAIETEIMMARRDLIIRNAQLYAIEIAKHKLYKRNAELMSVLKDVKDRVTAGISTGNRGARSPNGSVTIDPMSEVRQALDRWWKQQARMLNSQWQKINLSIHDMAKRYAILVDRLGVRHTSKASSRSWVTQTSSLMRNLSRVAAMDNQVVELIGLDAVNHRIKNWGRRLINYSPVCLSKRDKTDEHSVEALRLCRSALQRLLRLEREGLMSAGSARDLVRVMEVADWAISELDLEVMLEAMMSTAAKNLGSSHHHEGHSRRPSFNALSQVSLNLLSRTISRDPKATRASLAQPFKSLAATMRGTMHKSKPIQSIGRLVSGIQSSADLISDLGKGARRGQKESKMSGPDGHEIGFAEEDIPTAPMPLRKQRRRASLGSSAILQTAFMPGARHATHDQNEMVENPMMLSVTPRRLEDDFCPDSSTGNADADSTPRPAARSEDEANGHYASQKSSGSSQSPVTPSAMSSHGYHPYFDRSSPSADAENAGFSSPPIASQGTPTEEASLTPLFLSQSARRVKPKKVQRLHTATQRSTATVTPPTPARVEMWDQPQYQPGVWAPNDGRGRECF